MKITMLYAGLLALWFLVLSIKVIQGRSGPKKPSLGDGGDPTFLRVIRGHANFAEYVPLILIMMAMLEQSGASRWVMHTLGSALLFSRLMHGLALSFSQKFVLGRVLGASGTLLVLAATAVMCFVRGVMP